MNGDDPQLSQWNTDKETENIELYSNVSQVLKTIDANYIYCFPGEITMQNQKYKCPLELFKLKPKIAFRTAQQPPDDSGVTTGMPENRGRVRKQSCERPEEQPAQGLERISRWSKLAQAERCALLWSEAVQLESGE